MSLVVLQRDKVIPHVGPVDARGLDRPREKLHGKHSGEAQRLPMGMPTRRGRDGSARRWTARLSATRSRL